MCDINNDMVQRGRLFGDNVIECSNIRTPVKIQDEASHRKLTFGIDRLLSMSTPARNKEFGDKSLFLSSSVTEEEAYHSFYEMDKCDLCGKYNGSFPNFTKLSISDLNTKMEKGHVCEPVILELNKTSKPCDKSENHLWLSYPGDSGIQCSKIIPEPFPLRIGNLNLGQNLIPSNQEAELFTFPFATTPHFVQNWSNDKLTPYRTHNFIECSLQRGQSSCYNFNKLSSIDSRPTEKQSIISRRKRSWSRAVFSSLQRKGLEKTFQEQKYITKPDRKRLAATLGLHDSQVKVWFQNRRMKWRHLVKHASIVSSSQNTLDQASQSISPSSMSLDMTEMFQFNCDDGKDAEDDIIID
uniref:uncharacterized protein LOC120959095 n=1 Tax=Anopheles coluzzii TaxID=1518534 RepID=UPI0020FFE8AF|nr:uncharacterized protein LOC120959095 [Anopheles coluzzii]